jgi:flagellar basal body-associated protein FliL
MSDQQIDLGPDELDADVQAAPKKTSLLSPLIIRILSIAALIIVTIIISSIVAIVVVRANRPAVTSYPDVDTPFRKKVEHMAYLELENPFRQQLLDGRMIQLKISLGYQQDNKKLQQEISQIKPEIRDIVIKHLSRLRSDYFVDDEGASLDKLEDDFLKQINRIVNNGKVERILFQEYTLM